MERVLQIVGGGRMGEALLGGLIAAGRAPESLAVVEVFAARREQLESAYPGVTVADAPVSAPDALIAVKPGDAAAAVSAVAAAGAERVLSVMAGVTTSALEASGRLRVIRAMPNTPALIGAGASAIAAGSDATDEDMAWAEEILGAVGVVVRVPESQLDAVTGLSGSGPAYVFLVAEALIDAAVLAGLPRPLATRLTTQLLVGSSALLAERGDPAGLRAMVTSPGGTTAAGLHALEERAVRAAFAEAVAAAAARSRELGR